MFKINTFLKNLTQHSVLQIVIIQLLPFNTQGWKHLNGCLYNNEGSVQCDFQKWSPPLMDYEFGPEPVKLLSVLNINGTIPAGVMFQFIFLFIAYLCLHFNFMFEKSAVKHGLFLKPYGMTMMCFYR